MHFKHLLISEEVDIIEGCAAYVLQGLGDKEDRDDDQINLPPCAPCFGICELEIEASDVLTVSDGILDLFLRIRDFSLRGP